MIRGEVVLAFLAAVVVGLGCRWDGRNPYFWALGAFFALAVALEYVRKAVKDAGDE